MRLGLTGPVLCFLSSRSCPPPSLVFRRSVFLSRVQLIPSQFMSYFVFTTHCQHFLPQLADVHRTVLTHVLFCVSNTRSGLTPRYPRDCWGQGWGHWHLPQFLPPASRPLLFTIEPVLDNASSPFRYVCTLYPLVDCSVEKGSLVDNYYLQNWRACR